MARGIKAEWVHTVITLIHFLRTPDATKLCVGILKTLRLFPLPGNLGSPIDESVEVRDRIEKLVNRHRILNGPKPQDMIMRRLNAVRLKKALVQIHPVLRTAHV